MVVESALTSSAVQNPNMPAYFPFGQGPTPFARDLSALIKETANSTYASSGFSGRLIRHLSETMN
jgi:hypothetical protein